MAETTTTTPSTHVGINHAIQHIEITASEPDKLSQFLAKQFGWKFEAYPMQDGKVYNMFRTPDGNGGGVMGPMPGQPIAATPYINVADIEKTLKSCERDGAKILMPVTDVQGQGKFFWFQYAGGPPLACWQSTAPKA